MSMKKLGHIVNTFGLRGVLKVNLYTDCPEVRFQEGNVILINNKEYHVSSFKLKNAHLGLVGIEESKDINVSVPLIGNDIFADVDPLPGTIFIDDLIGMTISYKGQKNISKVKDVSKANSKDYLELENGKFIPFVIDVFVKEPDLATNNIELLDLGMETLELWK